MKCKGEQNVRNWFNIREGNPSYKQESPDEWLQSLADELVDNNRHLNYIEGKREATSDGVYWYMPLNFYEGIRIVLQYGDFKKVTSELLVTTPYDNYKVNEIPVNRSTSKKYLVQEINKELLKVSNLLDYNLEILQGEIDGQLYHSSGYSDLTPLTPYYKRINGYYTPTRWADKVHITIDHTLEGNYKLTLEGYGEVKTHTVSRKKTTQEISKVFVAGIKQYANKTTQAELTSLRDTWNEITATRKETTMDDKITVTHNHPHTVDLTLPEDIHEVNIKGATTGVKVSINTTGEDRHSSEDKLVRSLYRGQPMVELEKEDTVKVTVTLGDTTEDTQTTGLSLDVIASELEDTLAYRTKYRGLDVNVRQVNPEMGNIGGTVFIKNLTEEKFAEQAIRRPFNLVWDSERKRTFLSVSGDSVEGYFKYEDELNEKTVATWANSMLYNYIFFGSFLNDH